jgi:hypothetical protein
MAPLDPVLPTLIVFESPDLSCIGSRYMACPTSEAVA